MTGSEGSSLQVSMVKLNMEHSGPNSDPTLRDFLATCGRGELGCGARDTLGGGWDLLASSGSPPAETLAPAPFLCLEDLDGWLAGWQGPQGSTKTASRKESFASLTQEHAEEFHAKAAGPLLESPGVCAEELLRDGHLLPGSPKSQTKTPGDATQALFQASIRQAQLCVLDLQGEIDRQKEPQKSSSLTPPLKALGGPWGQDSALSHEPLLLATDSGEEEEDEEEEEDLSQEDEEEEEEEEEMECLFYNNPLFQENPSPTRTISFEEPTLGGQQAGPPPLNLRDGGCGGIHDISRFSRARGDDPPCQVAAQPPSAAEPTANEPDPFLHNLSHSRSLSPLVITEGELEAPPEGEEEDGEQGGQLQPPQYPPAQPAHSLSGSVSESPVAGTDPPGAQGLLFSSCSTSLMSALLEEPPKHPPSQQPPSSPRETRRIPLHTSPVPSVPAAEQGPWSRESEPRASLCSHRAPSCAWAEEAPGGTSCLQEEGSARDPHPASPLGSGRKSQEGSAEGRVVAAELPTRPTEEGVGDKEQEGEEEPAAPQHCPQGLSGDPGRMALEPGTKELADPEAPLFANGASGDQAAALRLASRLYHLDGFKRSQVAAFLRKNNEFSRMVAEAYLSFFHFQGQELDQALRLFLKAFMLTGETQERERILRHFAKHYHSCNPEAFLSPDAVHTLTCALMLLNTDLHGQKVGRSMSCQAFLTNLDGLNDGQNFPKELVKALLWGRWGWMQRGFPGICQMQLEDILRGLYHSIRQEKLEWAVDEEEGEAPSTPKSLPPPLATSQKKSNPFLTLLHDPGAQTYRQGPLARKVHAEADGKKTPWGKRGWKSFHTILKGTVLYFFKDENWTEASEEPIGVHHALAERASKYTKRPHVFRLQTADWHVFLFQAQSTEEMSSWISRINLVAAMFSSPPFPEAVGSQRKFVRPILPTAPCKNSLEDQYQAHEDCLEKASEDLRELQQNLPDKRSRGRHLEEYQLRKEYLLYEKHRYQTYLRLLEVKLSCAAAPASEDLDQWEAHLGEEVEEGSCPRLQKSHSSPSLNAEGSPPPAATPAAVKVKRNISERRTVRKIIPRRNKHLL